MCFFHLFFIFLLYLFFWTFNQKKNIFPISLLLQRETDRRDEISIVVLTFTVFFYINDTVSVDFILDWMELAGQGNIHTKLPIPLSRNWLEKWKFLINELREKNKSYFSISSKSRRYHNAQFKEEGKKIIIIKCFQILLFYI